MDYVFYQVGRDQRLRLFGHYLRAALIVNQCSNYAVTARRPAARRTSAGAAATPRRHGRRHGSARSPRSSATARRSRRRLGTAKTREAEPTPAGRDAAASAAPARRAAPPAAAGAATRRADAARRRRRSAQTDALLDYLFGGDG